ncbi:hypothetical protein Rxycam_00393 [Rubrobacter xylanophilus DSM 9941]|uniref:hypothetical protein n=1 Tax=Rubrobacter xylanophilus TaxID=49319 RepID=UPI001C63D438|nr:hypothetical protein [Rubrobacter xylanophilus]QYJ14591.1 hypothetical protein Rxycam_00393 [Rubrobacter xylanophilus DSM 9941]
MKGWGKVLTGVLLGVAGTVYATNEEVRRRLPGVARDLPETLRRRFQSAVAAAREASESRREEILRELRAREEASGRVSPNGGGASARDGEGR